MISSTREIKTESHSAPLDLDSTVSTRIAAWIFSIAVVLIYLPVIRDTASQWLSNDNYAHGFLIGPCSLFVLWLRRADFRTVKPRPSAWGLLLLALGLFIQVTGYVLQIKYVGMWSLPMTIAGGVLLFSGFDLWRVVRFSVLFLLFAAPIPNSLLSRMTIFLQHISAVGATDVMSFLGYAIIRHGNTMEVPGVALEVEYACSGFHKLISLLAFATLYGYVFTESLGRRFALVAVSLPIAIVSNVLRISILVAAASAGGMACFHRFHDPAEIIAIMAAFAMLVGVGKSLGCATARF